MIKKISEYINLKIISNFVTRNFRFGGDPSIVNEIVWNIFPKRYTILKDVNMSSFLSTIMIRTGITNIYILALTVFFSTNKRQRN